MSSGSTTAEALPYSVDARRSARNLVWGAFWRGIAHSLAKRRRIKQAVGELSALSDSMLADIGVQRSEIARVARYGRDIRA